MKNDFFLLDIPDFSPSYEEKIEYGYKNKAGKNLLELLRNISKNHCMYCYALLKSDRVDTGNLEHSIEKKLDEEHLEECVQNIALTCSHCNQSLKRTGEEERCKKILPQIELFREKVNCSGKMCKQECGPYKELKQEYGKVSRIILQPHGVHGINSQLKYCLQYDVKNAEFIPSTRYQYDEYRLLALNTLKIYLMWCKQVLNYWLLAGNYVFLYQMKEDFYGNLLIQ